MSWSLRFATPGHTSGSVCYICNDYIFTGDTLFRCSIGRTDLPMEILVKMSLSLEKLKALKEDYIVYPGHEAESTLDFEKNNNPYLKETCMTIIFSNHTIKYEIESTVKLFIPAIVLVFI